MKSPEKLDGGKFDLSNSPDLIPAIAIPVSLISSFIILSSKGTLIPLLGSVETTAYRGIKQVLSKLKTLRLRTKSNITSL